MGRNEYIQLLNDFAKRKGRCSKYGTIFWTAQDYSSHYRCYLCNPNSIINDEDIVKHCIFHLKEHNLLALL